MRAKLSTTHSPTLVHSLVSADAAAGASTVGVFVLDSAPDASFTLWVEHRHQSGSRLWTRELLDGLDGSCLVSVAVDASVPLCPGVCGG